MPAGNNTDPGSWGALDRKTPFSVCFGYDRGTPIDRFYIDTFLESSADLMHSPVLEVGDDQYARRFGRDQLVVDIVDADLTNGDATLVADLAEFGSLPTARYRCAIVTQTLQYVRDPQAAVANLHQSLAPGGALLVTVPAISRTDPIDEAVMADRWRFTAAGLRDLLCRSFDPGDVRCAGHGSLRSATAFLYGLAAEEVGDLQPEGDTEFPVVVCAIAVR